MIILTIILAFSIFLFFRLKNKKNKCNIPNGVVKKIN